MRRRKSPLPLVILLIALGIIGFVIYQSIFHTSKVFDLVTGHKESSIQESDGRTNVLILGIGGGTHDGPNLTDTIIFSSINRTTNAATLISVPRDLWVARGNGNFSKVNAVYADGQDNNPPTGLTGAMHMVSTITGQPVHYALRIDFTGFTKAIDLLGGIDVTVERPLDDYVYPIEGNENDTCGHTAAEITTWTNLPDNTATKAAELEFFPCRYMHLHINQGLQHMDGKTALMYARSRHATGVEGTDFARSRRQQLMIEAVRSKVFSLGTLTNINKINGLMSILKDSVDTNIPKGDIPDWIDILRQMKQTPIKSAVIDFGGEGRSGLLMQPDMSAKYDYASVLVPRVGDQDYSEIHAFISCELMTNTDCPVEPTPFESPTMTPPAPSAALRSN